MKSRAALGATSKCYHEFKHSPTITGPMPCSANTDRQGNSPNGTGVEIDQWTQGRRLHWISTMRPTSLSASGIRPYRHRRHSSRPPTGASNGVPSDTRQGAGYCWWPTSGGVADAEAQFVMNRRCSIRLPSHWDWTAKADTMRRQPAVAVKWPMAKGVIEVAELRRYLPRCSPAGGETRGMTASDPTS